MLPLLLSSLSTRCVLGSLRWYIAVASSALISPEMSCLSIFIFKRSFLIENRLWVCLLSCLIVFLLLLLGWVGGWRGGGVGVIESHCCRRS